MSPRTNQDAFAERPKENGLGKIKTLPNSSSRASDGVRIPNDIMAGLWQEASFAKLPPDAPKELEASVEFVGSPERVYTVHKACRRHRTQLLIEKLTLQLKTGCGVRDCTTATCFTCRKRLAGKGPLRRYSPTSARMLAVFLAGQDNPDRYLCPRLQSPDRNAPKAVENLIFLRPRSPPHPTQKTRTKSALSAKIPSPDLSTERVAPSFEKSRNSLEAGHKDEKTAAGHGHSRYATRSRTNTQTPQASPACQASIAENVTSKDHRSFAATAFSTVAYKMLGWLTPSSLNAISSGMGETGPTSECSPGPQETTGGNSAPDPDVISGLNTPLDGIGRSSNPQQWRSPLASKSPQTNVEGHSNRVSRDNQSTTAKLLPVENLTSPLQADEHLIPIKSPSLNTPHAERLSWSRKGDPKITPPIPEVLPKAAFHDSTKPSIISINPKSRPSVHSIQLCDSRTTVRTSTRIPDHIQEDKATKQVRSIGFATRPEEGSFDEPIPRLPQSLSYLDINMVDFICDVFQLDDTAEDSLLKDNPVFETGLPTRTQKKLEREVTSNSISRRIQWKHFNEQTLFNILSQPQSLIASFTLDNQLYDSETLWYCFARLTRVSPSLVLHSLWVAAERLLTPPEHINVPPSPVKPIQEPPLNNTQAGFILAICFHALVAAVPIVSDSRTMLDMSRIRATGSALGRCGPAPEQPPKICLGYDDIFSNDLALRLARRLCCALVARRYFAEIPIVDKSGSQALDEDADALHVLMKQINLLRDCGESILDFSPSERRLHQDRMPILLLDWARAVLLHDWDGKPDFRSNSAFSGAIMLMNTLYENRHTLLLGDRQFQIDHFSERLSSIHFPLTWIDSPSKHRQHLLDYPFLFSPETLVLLFRSLNFARMSRVFEESRSLKSRMNAIVDTGSLVTNPHHKLVLQDLLKTASSKYLVLYIDRLHVVRDAFDQLWRRENRELLRPLKVRLGEDNGEEGFDSGGVQQEFFRMAIAECLNPQYGAFTVDDRTRMAWFTPSSTVELWKYELIGLLVSLAIYNGLTLPVTFPRALYRKLLGEDVTELHHIADGWPDLANGLTTLLDWDESDGLIEDIFARTYEFSVPAPGGNITRPMDRPHTAWPQWSQHPALGSLDFAAFVTGENRADYVSHYIQYLTDVSVRPQYLAFQRGFRACLGDHPLRLLTSPILQSLVEGEQEIDISELRRYTRYVGWDASDPTIRNFWSVVKKFNDEMKRKLLEFVTASDRIPSGGIGNIQFVIQRNGAGDGQGARLPTAYTCYGTLLLPEYSDKELLREKLGVALENAQGFGFA